MAQASTAPARPEGFGATTRRDPWWAGPLATLIGLLAFFVYGTWAAWQGSHFEVREHTGDTVEFQRKDNPAVRPYLSPFYAPLIYDEQSHHAWYHGDLKADLGLPWWVPFTTAFLILPFPGLFRLTCYYYRKAYYRAFVADPPGCAVGEPWKGYAGENRGLGILQNSHRYWMYIACIFLVLLSWDALQAFLCWGTDAHGNVGGGWGFGVGVGSLVMLVNVILLSGFTFGCNSVRHLVGGRLDCFSCALTNGQKGYTVNTGYKLWHLSTWFNERHMEWAWLSLFSVGLTDVYIRLCSLGILTDLRLL